MYEQVLRARVDLLTSDAKNLLESALDHFQGVGPTRQEFRARYQTMTASQKVALLGFLGCPVECMIDQLRLLIDGSGEIKPSQSQGASIGGSNE